MIIRPQKGFQELFLSSPADIAIGGAMAGVGKTFALLLEPCRHISKRFFKGVFFRRTTPQIRNSGGLWDTSLAIYPYLRGDPTETILRWVFPGEVRINMTHLETENDIYSHDGAQYTYEAFDQLEHFAEKQFFYMLSRNRDAQSGVIPYIRATANPIPSTDETGGWLRNLISWYIGSDGRIIRDRSGVLRYFSREDGTIRWVDKDWKSVEGLPPTSFTFIGGTSIQEDNPILANKNPKYLSDLNSLDRVSRQRLKEGNWDAREENGMFESDWFKFVENTPIPQDRLRRVRYWDRAATRAEDGNNPDWTAGVLCCQINGEIYILDVQHFRGSPADNERKIKRTAEIDGKDVIIGFEEEGGSSGKDVAAYYQTNVLSGYTVIPDRPTGNKVDRCRTWCALAEQGHVLLKRGEWNREFINEAVSFPNFKKDQIDAVSGAFKMLNTNYRVQAKRVAY